jgi:hypothetical protein
MNKKQLAYKDGGILLLDTGENTIQHLQSLSAGKIRNTLIYLTIFLHNQNKLDKKTRLMPGFATEFDDHNRFLILPKYYLFLPAIVLLNQL